MKRASHILMIRPVKFGYNKQTAETNSFQNSSNDLEFDLIQKNAIKEFDFFVDKLKSSLINITLFEDTETPHTPDSIFPNNWISFHNNNSIVIYPMFAENRRHEIRYDIVNQLKKGNTTIIDFSEYSIKNIFLEGTGSIVFDYENKIAYANISSRTNKILLEKLCKEISFTTISFSALNENKNIIYHTNVLMSIGYGFAILCLETIVDIGEQKKVIDSLKNTGHEIIEIDYHQMNCFAGNIYQLFNSKNESYIVMSEQAFFSLNERQIKKIEHFGKIIHSPLYTIEKYGGGGARCMIADIRF